jgi:hypothetical protein
MNVLSPNFPIGLALSGVLLCGGLANAAGFPDALKVRAGTLVCGGSHFARLGGTELHRATYVLRNLGDDGVVVIDRARLFDANGYVRFDFPTDPVPVSVKTEIGPYQSTQIFTTDMLADELPPSDRPVQLHVDWSYSSDTRGVALNGSTVRTIRESDTGVERSRADSECQLLKYRW